jgi:hypothetical protein
LHDGWAGKERETGWEELSRGESGEKPRTEEESDLPWSPRVSCGRSVEQGGAVARGTVGEGIGAGGNGGGAHVRNPRAKPTRLAPFLVTSSDESVV